MNQYPDTDFVTHELFHINFDYEACMNDAFHKELYNIFRQAKSNLLEEHFGSTFDVYLHAAYKSCGYLTMDIGIYGPRAYHDMFDIAFAYMCQANTEDTYRHSNNEKEAEECPLFNPTEVFLIEHLAYIILTVKSTSPVPYQLIEVYEDQLTMLNDIERRIDTFAHIRKISDKEIPALEETWHKINYQLFAPIKALSIKYFRLVDVDFQLHAHDIDLLSYWENEKLTRWLCHSVDRYGNPIGMPQYSADRAKRFLHYWDYYEERHLMVGCIDEWSKANVRCFRSELSHFSRRYKVGSLPPSTMGYMIDGPTFEEYEQARSKAIAHLYDYIEQLDRAEQDEACESTPQPDASPTSAESPLHLALGKSPRTKVNLIRNFNVLHELGFFVDAYGQPISKDALFAALGTAFNYPSLANGTNNLYTSRSQTLGDHKAQLKFFDILKATQENILTRSDEKKRRGK